MDLHGHPGSLDSQQGHYSGPGSYSRTSSESQHHYCVLFVSPKQIDPVIVYLAHLHTEPKYTYSAQEQSPGSPWSGPNTALGDVVAFLCT